MSLKILFLVALLALTVSADSASWKKQVKKYKKEHKVTPELVRLEGPNGPNSIKTYKQAEKICKKAGLQISKSSNLLTAVKKRGYEHCTPCAWMKMAKIYYKNYRPVCGRREERSGEFYIKCADTPEEEGMAGYDVWCWGKTGSWMPADAVPINVGEDRGYVFVVKEPQNQILSLLSDASGLCAKRRAKLATSVQVKLAWYNGLSICACGWMENYSGMPIREQIASCGNSAAYYGCPHGALIHAYCFVDARAEPNGPNTVDFSTISVDTFPGAVERGAVQIYGGYVYPTISQMGRNKVGTIFDAYHTCKVQGASVATPDQLEEANSEQGLEHCGCTWAWENAELLYGVVVHGTGAVYKMSRGSCGAAGLQSCDSKNPDGDGWDVYCFKDCPDQCPAARYWNIPAETINVQGGKVFHVDSGEKYSYASEAEALAACQKYGAVLASTDQLINAQAHGLTKCRCGYLEGGKVGFPIYRAIEGCGNGIGVFSCPGNYQEIPEQGPNWDAYCFLSDESIDSGTIYDDSLAPDFSTMEFDLGVEQKDEFHHERPEDKKRVKLEGPSLLQKHKQALKEQEKLEKERKKAERKEQRAKEAAERKAKKEEERRRKEEAKKKKKKHHGLTRNQKQAIIMSSLSQK